MVVMLAAFALVLVSDQLSKVMIAARLEEGAFTTANIFGVRLRHVVNRRQPWVSTTAVRVMAVVWVLLTFAAIVAARRLDTLSIYVALGALVGGATGNLLDGFSKRSVTDFIDLRVWPVFNIADTAIVAGAALLLWTVLHSI